MAILFLSVDAPRVFNVTAQVPDGFVVGVVGEADSGAPELLALAEGVLAPQAGSVESNGPCTALVLDRPFILADAVARETGIAGVIRARRGGAPVLIYSHDETLIERLCDEVWWMSEGRIAHRGAPAATLACYRRHVARRLRSMETPQELAPVYRGGDGRAELVAIEARAADGSPTGVWIAGEQAAVRIEVVFHGAVEDPVVGMLIRSRIGMDVFGTNTQLEAVKLGPVTAGERLQVTYRFVCTLCPQEYTITAASHDPDGVWHDWMEAAIAITVSDTRYTAGVANLHATVEVQRK